VAPEWVIFPMTRFDLDLYANYYLISPFWTQTLRVINSPARSALSQNSSFADRSDTSTALKSLRRTDTRRLTSAAGEDLSKTVESNLGRGRPETLIPTVDMRPLDTLRWLLLCPEHRWLLSSAIAYNITVRLYISYFSINPQFFSFVYVDSDLRPFDK